MRKPVVYGATRKATQMNMTRRAFLTQAFRPGRADAECAGQSIRRAPLTVTAVLPSGATAGAAAAGAAVAMGRSLGLRDAIAHVRRNDHE